MLIILGCTFLVIYVVYLNAIQRPAEQAKNDYWTEQAETSPENFFLVCPPSQDGKPIPPKQCKRQGQYEYDRQQQIIDHKAQVSMRNAAWAGFALGIIGMILLGWTLIETRKAAKAASDTLDIARNATKAEFQPYLNFTNSARFARGLRVEEVQYDTLVVNINTFEFTHVGKTPISDLNISAKGKFYNQGRHFEVDGRIISLQIGDMNPNDVWDCAIEFLFSFPDGDAQSFEKIKEFDISVFISFTDMFSTDKIRRYEVHYLYDGSFGGAKLQSVKEIKQR